METNLGTSFSIYGNPSAEVLRTVGSRNRCHADVIGFGSTGDTCHGFSGSSASLSSQHLQRLPMAMNSYQTDGARYLNVPEAKHCIYVSSRTLPR